MSLTEQGNQAAWLGGIGELLHVDKIDLPTPGPDEIIVKNQAIAINPVDWKVQDIGLLVTKWPTVLGQDVAGEVYAVGENVTRFKKGDRVLSHTLGLFTGEPKHGGFQHYTAAPAAESAIIPSSISFAEASVLPLAIDTAALGLYQSREAGYFGLPLPSLNPISVNETILVYGGSSSVGSLAIQLATASGAKVVAVGSAHNHAYLKQLGASAAIDYKTATSVEDSVREVKAAGGTFVGVFDAIASESSYEYNLRILEKLGGGNLCTVFTPPPPDALPGNVKAASIHIRSPITYPIWEHYVTPALEQGKLRAVPEPLIAGKGLESVQKGLDVNKKGVSARKVVVEL